jgi:glycosyltransferase involved in cell wall biosynthesis
VDGYLRPPDDIAAMAEIGVTLLTDRGLHQRIGDRAVRTVRERFCLERVVPRYEEYYRAVLEPPLQGIPPPSF